MTTIFRAAPLLRSRAPLVLRARPTSSSVRSFAVEAPQGAGGQGPKSSSSFPLGAGIAAGGAALLGAAYAFGYIGGDQDPKRLAETAGKTAKGVAEAQLGLKKDLKDYQKVYNKIADSLEVEGYDDGSMGPVLVRLAWHASGTYDKDSKTGGSNYATMRFEPESKHGANNGLNLARDHMEKIKKEFDWISYGDLWTLGGVAAVQEMGGPYIPWRPGRIDGYDHQATPDGRLPDASQTHDHLRSIFYRMGFNDQEIVALSGAHSLGRCHTDRSGFDGPWQFAPTSFNNEYFKLLLNEKWGWKKWAGPKQYEDVKTKSLMMLPTDMALIKDKSFAKTAKAYANDEDLFFKDFAAVFHKLLELGVPTSQFPGEPWQMKTTSDQGLE